VPGTGEDNHPQPKENINAPTEARPPGRDARIRYENIMHKIKETVCDDPNPHQRGKNESAHDRYCRKRGGDDQFPGQGVA
jgi:hypothetical protein